ncbi:MAG: DNA double-strand break repair nuclease NurA [Anaerolineae bacterium]
MGRALAHRNASAAEKVKIALQWLSEACDLEPIRARIERVRQSNVSGYRGATPLDETLCGPYPSQPEPEQAVLVAADGSQIYPDPHGQTLYYLTNIGRFQYFVGLPYPPEQATHPELIYQDGKLQDRDGRAITNQTVNARRTLLEAQALAETGWAYYQRWQETGEWAPVALLHDGNLLKVFGANDVTDASKIEADYLKALQQARDSGAVLAGYVDRPRGSSLISLLHLLHLPENGITETALRSNGELEGVTDELLFRYVLHPGERSALMALNSPQNREYKDRDPDLEIAFFYINVALPGEAPKIARVDVPMNVARNPAHVHFLHGLLLAQCAIQGRKRYPYVLTRADELAYVNGQDRGQLDELIRIAMLQNDLETEQSNKLQTKGLARGERRQHRLRA